MTVVEFGFVGVAELADEIVSEGGTTAGIVKPPSVASVREPRVLAGIGMVVVDTGQPSDMAAGNIDFEVE